MFDYTTNNWSHWNSNEKPKGKFGSYTRKTFDRFTTKDSYTWNITHNDDDDDDVDDDVYCFHYVNFDFVSGHFLRRGSSYMIASKGAVDINCASGRTA